MNLEQSMQLETFRVKEHVVTPKTKSRVQVAQRVFQLCAEGGFPYTKTTPEKWAHKWLPSHTFTLMEMDINAAASINRIRSTNRVSHYFQCSAKDMDPVVVDFNKRKKGMTASGYYPKIVYQDGHHRKQALLHQGHTKILAWVGSKALRYMEKKGIHGKVIQASDDYERQINTSTWKDKVTPLFELSKATSKMTVRIQAGGPGSGRRKELESLQRQAEDSHHQSTDLKEKEMWRKKSEGYQHELNKLKANGPGASLSNGSGSNPMVNDVKGGGPGSGRRPGFGKDKDEYTMSRHGKEIGKLSEKHANSNMYDRGAALSKEELSKAVDHIKQGRAYYDEDEGAFRIMSPNAPKQSQESISSQVKQFVSDVKYTRGGYKDHVKVKACGARSSGSLEKKDSSDVKVPPDSSDSSTFVSSSDRLDWNPDKPQPYTPGTGPDYVERFTVVSPGINDPFVLNPGASRSELSRTLRVKAGKKKKKVKSLVKSKGIKLDKLFQKRKA